MEAQFHQGSLSDAWKGLKTISGMENSKSTSEWPIEEQNDFSEQLNDFYCRFERRDLINDLERTICDLSENKVNTESVEVEHSMSFWTCPLSCCSSSKGFLSV